MESKREIKVDTNRDFIDRKIEGGVGGVERLFHLALKSPLTLLLVLSILANIYLGNKLIKTNEEMRIQIIEEVRRQVPVEVQKETSEQLNSVSEKVDTIYNQSKEFYRTIKEIGGVAHD